MLDSFTSWTRPHHGVQSHTVEHLRRGHSVYFLQSSQKVSLATLQKKDNKKDTMMKFILVLLTALPMAQASRLGLLRVGSSGLRHRNSASRGEFGVARSRNLQKEDGFA